MNEKHDAGQALAAAITKAGSKQTYYTIRLFVKRERIADAYRSYAYFRWVDDILDGEMCPRELKLAFANRQLSLLDACYRGEAPGRVSAEEQMLVDLVRSDSRKDSGLHTYLEDMMAVMIFDAGRRGRVISQAELNEYSCLLATAVTEALYYFIGYGSISLPHEDRYLAVTAAHVTHMLRDAHEDADAGYFNIPDEYLHAHAILPSDVESPAYREWVRSRVQLARRYFQAGLAYIARVPDLRCRLAGFAYTARFEWMLNAIERDNYHLRFEYPERKSLRAGLWMAWSALAAMIASLRLKTEPLTLITPSGRIENP